MERQGAQRGSRAKFLAVAAVIAGLVFLLGGGSLLTSEGPYTARVINAQTGQPIQGAVYLAAWWKESYTEGSFFEGTSTVMRKYVEGVSDQGGRIVVPGYWRRWPFQSAPTLTVYKPGYLLWNQERDFSNRKDRTDFDAGHRTVQLELDGTKDEGFDQEDRLIASTHGALSRPPYEKGNRMLYMAFATNERTPSERR